MRKLREKLKKYLKNNFVADIFVIGSAIKGKIEAKDIDIIILFKEKNYEKIGDIIYRIKEDIGAEKLHIEPLIVKDMFREKIFASIIHEGISIRHNKSIGKLIGYNSFSLFIFSLKNLKNINKVRFAQAIYGRKGKGILHEEGGKSLGKGTFIVPVGREHLFREVMAKFQVKSEVKRILIKD